MEGTKKTDLFHRSAHPKSLEFEKIGERQGRIEKKHYLCTQFEKNQTNNLTTTA